MFREMKLVDDNYKKWFGSHTAIITKNIKKVGDCWEWQKFVNEEAYGSVSYGGRSWRSHRLAYFLFKGAFDPSLNVCHKCDNPKCCNPAHLFLGTRTDNMQDAIKKGRFRSVNKPPNPKPVPRKLKESMILLPSNNRCSQLSVHPKNWQLKSADISKPWYISYRFYSAGKVKRVEIRGMNFYKDHKTRAAATELLLTEELKALKDGYNPITLRDEPLEGNQDLNPYTPFTAALELAANRLSVKRETKNGILIVVKEVSTAAQYLRLHRMPISEVKRKHLIDCVNRVGEQGVNMTNNNYNHYRRYLGMVFSELVQVEAIEHSPVDKHYKKRHTIKKLREVLTDEERSRIDKELLKYPEFRRFVHIFYHSGARITELLSVKGKDVDMMNQRYKCTINKGKQKREVWRIITDGALPYWEEMPFKNGDYIFSRYKLKPGPHTIKPKPITDRWRKIVKKGLGIEKDLYALKHLRTTETVDLLSESAAAKMNAHTSEQMVREVYDTKNKSRKDEELKGLHIKFA